MKFCSKNKKLIVISIIIFFGCILVYSSIKIFIWQKENNIAQRQLEEIKATVIKNNDIDFKLLKEKNPDTVAWLKIPETKIDYPVVQTKDNDYYLFHTIDREVNQAGWIFGDYRNDFQILDKNTVIYGHGSLSGIMFGTLKNVIREREYKNQIIELVTEKEKTNWQIFSAYHIKTTDDYLKISFNSNDEFMKYIELISSRSAYNFNNNPDENDKILTLSTCYNDEERMVVHAKIILP